MEKVLKQEHEREISNYHFTRRILGPPTQHAASKAGRSSMANCPMRSTPNFCSTAIVGRMPFTCAKRAAAWAARLCGSLVNSTRILQSAPTNLAAAAL